MVVKACYGKKFAQLIKQPNNYFTIIFHLFFSLTAHRDQFRSAVYFIRLRLNALQIERIRRVKYPG